MMAMNVVTAGDWYHVAVTYDGNVGRLFVNGVKVREETLGAFTLATGSGYDLNIGRRPGIAYFTGRIDEPAVYSTALSATRVLAHYDAGRKAVDRTDFGMLTPPFAKVTGDSAGQECAIGFGSNNDTAMLKVYQADRDGNAMSARPTSGVIGYWPLNGSLADLSPIGNSAVLGAAPKDPSYSTSKPGLGQGLLFDVDAGASDEAWIPDAPAYQNLDTFTVSLWFKTSSIANQAWPVLIQKADYGATPVRKNFEIAFGRDAGSLLATVRRDGGTVDSTLSVPAAPWVDGVWHHLALAVDGSGTRLYLDGVERASSSLTGDVDNTTTPIGITLAAEGGNSFDGEKDEIRIDNVARTEGEIYSYFAGSVDQYSNTGAAGDKDWSSTAATTRMFGACLSSAPNATANWVASSTCPKLDNGSWRAIPASPADAGSKVASTASGVANGTANLRFGFRGNGDLPPGSYTAPLVFEAIAPAV